MQINFDSYPAEVRRENEYLRDALGSAHGHQRYQWAFSDDLVMPLPVFDGPNPVFDYHCACGINVSIHSANCQWSTPRIRWELANIAFGLQGVWVFVRWNPPEMDRETWEACYGSYPYPDGGYFIPVSDCARCIHIPSGSVPLRPTSAAIVAETIKHETKTAGQHTQDIVDRMDKAAADKKEEWRLKFLDAFPVHEGFPGKKENWSAGGIGESPVLVTK